MCYIKGMKDIRPMIPKRDIPSSPVFSDEFLRGIMDTDEELNLELLQNAAVEGRPEHSLSACLNAYTKAHLQDLAQDHALHIPSSFKKQQVVGKVASHLVKQFPRMLPYFPHMNLEFLAQFKDSPAIEVARDALKFRDISHAHNYGFLFLYRTGDSYTAVVPRELLGALELLKGKEIWEAVNYHQRLNAYAVSLSNLYGVLDIDQYAIVWNRFEAEKLTPAMVEDELVELGNVQYYWWFEDELVISSYFQNAVDVAQFLEKVKQVTYYKPTRDDLIKFFATPYDDESPAASAMLEFLSGYQLPDGEQIEDLMDDLSDTCIVGEGMQDVFNLLNEYGLLFSGMEEITRFTELYAQLSDHCRKWELRGHTPVGLKKHSPSN